MNYIDISRVDVSRGGFCKSSFLLFLFLYSRENTIAARLRLRDEKRDGLAPNLLRQLYFKSCAEATLSAQLAVHTSSGREEEEFGLRPPEMKEFVGV